MSHLIESMMNKYNPSTPLEFENSLKEIIQEIALTGLARAQFFEKAAFYGGTALRIFYGLPRFSEDLDFTLVENDRAFSLNAYFSSVKESLQSFGFEIEIEKIQKTHATAIDSAFIKANTKIHLLKINTAKKFAERINPDKKINIKFEIDTDPPLGFETEIKILTPPITSAVRVLKPSYLLSGKISAILYRKWKNRVKGRDYYDLLWYLGQKIPYNLSYLENIVRANKEWDKKEKMKKHDVILLLHEKINSVDFKVAAQDVTPFIKDSKEVSIWSKDFFLAAIDQLKCE